MTGASNAVIMVCVGTLAFVVIAVVGVFLVGLFDSRVDNAEIFKIVGPAFGMIVGSFVGLVGGYAKGFADGGKAQ